MNKNKAKHSRPALTEPHTSHNNTHIPADFTFTLTPAGFATTHSIPTTTLINLLFSVVAAVAKDKYELTQPVATACDNLLAYCFPEDVFPSREELLSQLEAEDRILKERVANGEGVDIDFVEWREKQLEKIKELQTATLEVEPNVDHEETTTC